MYWTRNVHSKKNENNFNLLGKGLSTHSVRPFHFHTFHSPSGYGLWELFPNRSTAFPWKSMLKSFIYFLVTGTTYNAFLSLLYTIYLHFILFLGGQVSWWILLHQWHASNNNIPRTTRTKSSVLILMRISTVWWSWVCNAVVVDNEGVEDKNYKRMIGCHNLQSAPWLRIEDFPC